MNHDTKASFHDCSIRCKNARVHCGPPENAQSATCSPPPPLRHGTVGARTPHRSAREMSNGALQIRHWCTLDGGVGGGGGVGGNETENTSLMSKLLYLFVAVNRRCVLDQRLYVSEERPGWPPSDHGPKARRAWR